MVARPINHQKTIKPGVCLCPQPCDHCIEKDLKKHFHGVIWPSFRPGRQHHHYQIHHQEWQDEEPSLDREWFVRGALRRAEVQTKCRLPQPQVNLKWRKFCNTAATALTKHLPEQTPWRYILQNLNVFIMIIVMRFRWWWWIDIDLEILASFLLFQLDWEGTMWR